MNGDGTQTALQSRYEFYYQVVRRGQYYRKIDEMHERYGNDSYHNSSFEANNLQDQLYESTVSSCTSRDSSFYDELYNFKPEIEKRKYLIDKSNIQHDFHTLGDQRSQDNGSLQWTANDDLHRMRRRPYNPFFSIQPITKLEDLIHESLYKLLAHFDRGVASQQPFDVSTLYRCFLADNICDYAFGCDVGFLADPEKGKELFEAHRSVATLGYLFMEVPGFLKILLKVAHYLPTHGGIAAFGEFKEVSPNQHQQHEPPPDD